MEDNRGLDYWNRPDGVTTTPDFWPLIFNQRLLEVVRLLIGSDARYTQHSDLHVNGSNTGWHRDNVDRTFMVGRDWDEREVPYRVVRVAIYLQSFAESGSALGVIPGTHQFQSRLNSMELRLWGSVLARAAFRLMNSSRPPSLTKRPVWNETNPGDCVIFDQRLLHSASKTWGPKYAIFLSYGADNEHSRDHQRYYLFGRRDLAYKEVPEPLARSLREAGLYLELER